MHRIWIVAASGIGLIVSLMAVTLLSATFSRAPFIAPPRTYHAAVIGVLNRHAIPYRDVQVHDGCQPNPSDCFAISVIVIRETYPVAGQIACRLYHEDCTVSVPGLGLRRIALPPLEDEPRWLREMRFWTRRAWCILGTVRYHGH